MTPILTTARLLLRPLEMADAKDLARALMDREAMKHYDKVYEMEDVDAWIDKNLQRYQTDGFGLWALIRREDGAFLGDCGITWQEIDGERLPEVGFHTIREYCRQGYATEAARGSLRYAFTTLGFDKVYSYCTKANLPSQGVMKKCGLSLVKEYIGRGREIVVYAIRKEEFEALI